MTNAMQANRLENKFHKYLLKRPCVSEEFIENLTRLIITTSCSLKKLKSFDNFFID